MTTFDPTPTGVPVADEVIFTDHKGERRPKVERHQRKFLAKVEPLLRAVLEPGETVQLVAEAQAPISVMEFLTTGWMITVIKRCLLVATDRRLLHIPVKGAWFPKRSISQMRYDHLESARVTTGLGSKLKLRYYNGKSEVFTGLRGAGAKKLRQILEGRTGHGQASLASGREFLCPRCARPLPADAERCEGCHLAFKSRKRAILHSLLWPGGGYFYTEHPVLGIFDAITETFLLVFVIVFLVAALDGDPEGWTFAAVFAGLLVFEKLLTIYHAGHYVREAIPADPHFRVGFG